MSNYYTLLFDDHVTTDELEQLLEQFGMDDGLYFEGEHHFPSTTAIKVSDDEGGVAIRLIQSIYDCDVNLDTVQVVIEYQLGDDLDYEFFDAHEKADEWCDSSGAMFPTNTRDISFEVPAHRLDEFIGAIKQNVRGDYKLYVGDGVEQVNGVSLVKVVKPVESVTDFRCKDCREWWSIGDAPERDYYCPWCGELNEF